MAGWVTGITSRDVGYVKNARAVASAPRVAGSVFPASSSRAKLRPHGVQEMKGSLRMSVEARLWLLVFLTLLCG
jgi:hypothetical protein